VSALAIGERSPGSMKMIVGKAKALSDDLKIHHDACGIIPEVIDKVIVHEAALELRLQRNQLAGLLGSETRSEDPIHVVTSPCKLARRGQDLKFILPLLEDSNTFSRQDPALIQGVAKAQLWWEWIKIGEAQVTRWLRLAFLSPTLVRQIRAGVHPSNLTIETLTRQVDLPTNWQEQEALVAAID